MCKVSSKVTTQKPSQPPVVQRTKTVSAQADMSSDNLRCTSRHSPYWRTSTRLPGSTGPSDSSHQIGTDRFPRKNSNKMRMESLGRKRRMFELMKPRLRWEKSTPLGKNRFPRKNSKKMRMESLGRKRRMCELMKPRLRWGKSTPLGKH